MTDTLPSKSALTRDKILGILATVEDPEIGLSIVDLGLIHRLEITPEAIDLSLGFTIQACPLKELIVQWVRHALEERCTQTITITTEEAPPWTPDRLTPEGRRQLGFGPEYRTPGGV